MSSADPAGPTGGSVALAPPLGGAVELARSVRAGERSARQVVDAHLARIEAAEGRVHAFNLVLAEQARAEADALDARVAAGDDPGPLAGRARSP